MEGRPARLISDEERGQFLLDYMQLLLTESANEDEGFRHSAGQQASGLAGQPAVGRERWVINKIRALCSWYTKGFEGGAQFRIGVNTTKSIPELEDLIQEFFLLARQPASPLA
jgi:tRNA-dihydrouridine synthase